MSTLYVDRNQAEILSEGGRILIWTGEEQQSIPWLLVDRIVIAAKASIRLVQRGLIRCATLCPIL